MQLGYNWVFFLRWGNADKTVYLAGNKEKDKVPKLGFWGFFMVALHFSVWVIFYKFIYICPDSF